MQLESLANVGTCRDCDLRRSLLLTNHPGRGFLGQQLGSGGAGGIGAAADQATLPATRTVYLDLAGWLRVGIIAGSPDTIGTVRQLRFWV